MIFVYPLTKRKKKKAWSRADKIALLVLVHNVGDFMEKTTQHGGARAGAGRKKGSTTNNTG